MYENLLPCKENIKVYKIISRGNVNLLLDYIMEISNDNGATVAKWKFGALNFLKKLEQTEGWNSSSGSSVRYGRMTSEHVPL